MGAPEAETQARAGPGDRGRWMEAASVAPRVQVVSWGEGAIQEDAQIPPQVMGALGNTGTSERRMRFGKY